MEEKVDWISDTGMSKYNLEINLDTLGHAQKQMQNQVLNIV